MFARFRLTKPYILISLALCHFALGAQAQTTAFTFQGKLNDNGIAANGGYDIQLKLYDVATVGSGTQIGVATFSSVAVVDGVFTVQPDFTASAFPGADRFVEVGVKPAGSGNPFTILSPRQPITPTPYALHSLTSSTANSATNATTASNSTQLGGQPAANYVQTADARLSDARAPLAGSTNYIQNTTTQETGNFNISGNGILGGKVGIGTATPQSNLEVKAAPFSYGITQTDGTVRLSTYTDGTYGWLGTPTNHPLLFYTNSTFRMSLDTSGRLGIGVLAPQAPLNVVGTSWFQGDTTPLPAAAGKGIAVGFAGEQGYIQAFDYGAFTGKNLLLNNSGGNVGIGTTSPVSKLAVQTGTGNYGMTHTDGTITLGSYIGGASSGGSGGWLGTQSNHKLFFFTNNGQPAVTLDTTGNVGIGTTTPGSKLEIAAQDGLKITGFEPFLTLRDTNFSNAQTRIQNANGDINLFTQSYLDGSNPSSFVHLHSANGAVGIGTSNPFEAKLEVDGGSLNGVYGSSNFKGLWGDGSTATNSVGVYGSSSGASGYGLYGIATGANSFGVYGKGPRYAGYFEGDVHITGIISKGGGSFKIDDPLDPPNKYLYHSFIESPDMMNVYNGNVITDGQGMATVILPAYFEALNREFRYQLTAIGQFAQVIVSKEVEGNQFDIRSDKPNVKVSWQVTGIRHDKFADDKRIPVEEDKPVGERGVCLYEPACR